MLSLRTSPSVRSAVSLVALGGLTALAAAIGARATTRGKGLWYRLLRKPSYNPPDWVFGPVWTVLYTAMAVSAWRLVRRPPSVARNVALGLWGTQLGLNTAWSVLFFGQHKKRAALADLGLLVGSIGGYMAAASKVDRPAALLMAPYLGWSSFAGLLNAEIVRRNPW
ncbi:MAG: TspO/MBR family protein [Polyangia bacterium]